MIDSVVFVERAIENAAWLALEEVNGSSLEDKLALAEEDGDEYEVAVLTRALEVVDLLIASLDC